MMMVMTIIIMVIIMVIGLRRVTNPICHLGVLYSTFLFISIMQPLMTLSIFASKTYHMSTSPQYRVQKKGGPCVLSPIVVAKYIKVSPTLHVAMEHARRSDA
jgi:hypothetical protein